MLVQSCPVCRGAAVRLLLQVSLHAQVNYHRCEACGHVWTVPKYGDLTKRRDVTEPKREDPPQEF